MKARTRARSIALQVLYEIDIVAHPPLEALKARLEDEPLAENLVDFSREILLGILPIRKELDRVLERYAPEWPLDQIAPIDRNILRLAVWEFAVRKCTPVKVAINEAVELAKLFGSDNAARFINGVLGSLADNQNEIEQVMHSRDEKRGES